MTPHEVKHDIIEQGLSHTGSKNYVFLIKQILDELGFRILFLKDSELASHLLAQEKEEPEEIFELKKQTLFDHFGLMKDLDEAEHKITLAIAELFRKHKHSFTFPPVSTVSGEKN